MFTDSQDVRECALQDAFALFLSTSHSLFPPPICAPNTAAYVCGLRKRTYTYANIVPACLQVRQTCTSVRDRTRTLPLLSIPHSFISLATPLSSLRWSRQQPSIFIYLFILFYFIFPCSPPPGPSAFPCIFPFHARRDVEH